MAITSGADVPTGETIADRVEYRFIETVRNLLPTARVEKEGVVVTSNGNHPEYPLLKYSISDAVSGIAVHIGIPAGIANESGGIYFARISEGNYEPASYRLFRSVDDIATEAGAYFKRQCSVSVMGI